MRRLVLLLALAACKRTDDAPPPEPSPIDGVPLAGSWSIPGMTGDAEVVRNEQGIPWVYATNRADLGRVVGFVLARDRYFYMDLARRLAQGRVAELLGADALSADIESRMTGMAAITEHLTALVEADPEMSAYFEGVAVGVTAHVEAVRQGQLPPPTEYGLAAGLLGKAPTDLMTDFALPDVVAGMVTVLYQSGFETKDVGRAADALALDTLFDGAPEGELREAGLWTDAWGRVEPVYAIASAPDWLPAPPAAAPSDPPPARRVGPLPVAPEAVLRLHQHTQRIEARFDHDWVSGFGSNAWAVSGEASADGRAMIATDGHLGLTIPPLFYQIGIDTQHLGGGDIHQVGMMTPAMPLMSTGTNGDIAFGQTQLIGDITDWYREVLTLDAQGAPATALFQGESIPLVATAESFDVANIPLLGSVGGATAITRYTTADGRWITSIEGAAVSGPQDAGPGQTAVNLMGDWVIPSDTDGDGLITAVSFDYAGLSLSNMAGTIDRYNRATDVEGFAEATRDLVAYSLNLVAADKSGSILYTGFQATPCRDYLERDAEGVWTVGSDPNLLLDGTRYGGFDIPLTADGRVDFSQTDPYRCVIPWEEIPHSQDPAQGYLVTANNDPGGLTFDGSLTNDARYMGGPWMEGYRAAEIDEELAAIRGTATLADMQRIQADHTSLIGEQLTPVLLDAIQQARVWATTDQAIGPADGRAADLYLANQARIDEVETRLTAWAARGHSAESGVETFYHAPDAGQVEDSVATMIFNAWMGRFVGKAVNDEGIPGLGWPTGDTGRFRLLKRMLEGRGEGNPLDMGSFYEPHSESIYFDDRATPDIEHSTEIAIRALVEALDFLAGPGTGPGAGGFETEDMSQWLWGLRHWVRFDSLLSDFFDTSDPLLGSIVKPLVIDTEDIDVMPGLAADDPRADLPGFPRHADNLCVDAGNSGTSGTQFNYGSGPVWRLVVALGDAGFEAYNVLPGGQSGLADSLNFADQAPLWLGNEALPVPLDPADVAAQSGATREHFSAP
jgi:penicillin amidase